MIDYRSFKLHEFEFSTDLTHYLKKMKSTNILAIAALVIAGCGTPEEKAKDKSFEKMAAGN